MSSFRISEVKTRDGRRRTPRQTRLKFLVRANTARGGWRCRGRVTSPRGFDEWLLTSDNRQYDQMKRKRIFVRLLDLSSFFFRIQSQSLSLSFFVSLYHPFTVIFVFFRSEEGIKWIAQPYENSATATKEGNAREMGAPLHVFRATRRTFERE